MSRWTGVALALALVLALGWGYYERVNRTQVAFALEANFQREFYDLLNQVEQVEVLLAKSLASSSARRQALYLTEIWSRASSAQASLAQLPFTGINMAATRKFLAQVGDYSYRLAEASLSGQNITSGQLEQLDRFHTEIGELSKDLHRIEARLARGGFQWGATMQRWPMRTARAAAGQQELDEFMNIDKRLQGLPALVYDGPFSDHIERRKPRGLTGDEVDRTRAGEIARDYIDTNRRDDYRVTTARDVDGRIEAHSLVLTSRSQTGSVALDIAKKGGHVIYMLNNRFVGDAELDGEQALEKAREFLAERGYGDLEATYSIRQMNTQVITFVAKEGEVILYPDMIKVKVALDNGQVVGVDAMGYLMAHTKRNLPQPKLTEKEVRDRLNPRLQVEQIRLALIPMDGGREVLTYEVKAKLGPDRFLIYINAQSGIEERILGVVDLPGGQLVM